LLEIQHALTEKTRRLVAIGAASQLDLLAQESAEAVTAQSLPPLQKQWYQTRDALAALLGLTPSELTEEGLKLSDLTLPENLPVTLPAKLIEQRPDVRQAEANLHAASAQVGVAIAAFLPQIPLTATIGSNSLKIENLFAPHHGLWDLTGSLTQTLFDGGALLHKRRAADAALDLAGAQYRSAVLLAFQNVADSLRALQTDADALKANETAERATKRTFELARQQFALGTVSEVALNSSEQAYLQAELSLVQAQANRFADTAGLFQALGGGWWNHPLEASND
jgi:NodT family efflux transporter outer membrane factor (OMF) lipoprotein